MGAAVPDYILSKCVFHHVCFGRGVVAALKTDLCVSNATLSNSLGGAYLHSRQYVTPIKHNYITQQTHPASLRAAVSIYQRCFSLGENPPSDRTAL